jgi:hypothetical protein
MNNSPTHKLNFRWFISTPARLLTLLFIAEAALFVCNWFRWTPKGYAVLFAIAAVGAYLTVMLLWWLAALTFRWRFQFTLRTLFVLTIAVALPCSWLAVEMNSAKQQRKMIEEIQESGGSLVYLNGFDHSVSPTALKWLSVKIGQAFFLDVAWFVFRDHQAVTDATLDRLKVFPHLKTLYLNDSRVTDDGLRQVKEFTQLEALDIGNTGITDAGLEHVKGLNTLHTLFLQNTKVTDAGVSGFKKALPNVSIVR